MPVSKCVTAAAALRCPISNAHALLIAAAIGILAIMATLPLTFIAGTHRYFETGDTDIVVEVGGFRHFLIEPWSWPLLKLSGLGNPEGMNIAYTDSLPLLALIAKALGPVWPASFNPFGLWAASNILLNGLFATVFIRSIGARSILAVVAAALVATTMPILDWRMNHIALSSHWLILAQLWLYVRVRRAAEAPASRWSIAAATTPALALLVHPYLFAMTFCIMVATFISTITHPLRLLYFIPPAASALLCATLIVACGQAGPFAEPDRSSGAQHLYGIYSLNGFSPLWPYLSGFIMPFVHLPMLDVTGGQYDGYAWLGFGVLALLTLVTLNGGYSKIIRPAVLRHKALGGLLSLFVLFALSNRITIGLAPGAMFPMPAEVLTVAELFRASGRFFWPLAYLLALLPIAWAERRWPSHHGTAIILFCGVLQLVDTSGSRQALVARIEATPAHRFDWDKFEALAKPASGIAVYPSYGCEASSVIPSAGADLDLGVIASLIHKPINSVHNARLSKDCTAEALDAQSKQSRPTEIRVWLQAEHPDGRHDDDPPTPPEWTATCDKLAYRGGTMRICAPAAAAP